MSKENKKWYLIQYGGDEDNKPQLVDEGYLDMIKKDAEEFDGFYGFSVLKVLTSEEVIKFHSKKQTQNAHT